MPRIGVLCASMPYSCRQQHSSTRLVVWVVFAALSVLLQAGAVRDMEYYDKLGVKSDASDREIRKAFKKLALKLHPDKNPGDKSANEKFLQLNLAYETLKDPEMRKKYDRLGRKGLEDMEKGGGGYEDYNFYQQEFGLYDDDEQVETLNYMSFKQMHSGDEVWVVNFYSPRCSHCHDLAPDWRELGNILENIVGVGAVNCQDSWQTCQDMGVRSYPTIIRFSKGDSKEKYRGRRTLDNLVQFALQSFPKPTPVLLDHHGKVPVHDLTNEQAKLLIVCEDEQSFDCDNDLELLKLSAYLYPSTKVVTIDCNKQQSWCKNENVEFTHARLFPKNGTTSSGIRVFPPPGEVWESSYSVITLGDATITQLPLAEALSAAQFNAAIQAGRLSQDVIGDVSHLRWAPISLSAACEANWEGAERSEYFEASGIDDCKKKCVANRLCTAIDYFEQNGWCNLYHDPCKEPLMVEGGATSYNLYRGNGVSAWLILFLPGSANCAQSREAMNVLRRLSSQTTPQIVLKRVVCDHDPELCARHRVNQVDFPTWVLYKHDGYQVYSGKSSAGHIMSWAKHSAARDVVSLTNAEVPAILDSGDLWFINFFIPNCQPCEAIMPNFREASIRTPSTIKTLDCKTYPETCTELGIHSYPSPVLFNRSKASAHFLDVELDDPNEYIELIEDVLHPPLVELTPSNWDSLILHSKELWIIAFTAGRWCGPCVDAMRELKIAAKELQGSVRYAYMDCDLADGKCQSQHYVDAYPTIKRYREKKGWDSMHSGMVWADNLVNWAIEWLPNRVKRLTGTIIDNEILGSSNVWLVAYSCPRWCRPCKQFQSTQKFLAQSLRGEDVYFGHIDCDDHRSYCNSQGIQSYPTIRLYNSRYGSVVNTGNHRNGQQMKDYIMGGLPEPIPVDAAIVDSLMSFYKDHMVEKRRKDIEYIVRRHVDNMDVLFDKLEEKYKSRPTIRSMQRDEL